MVTTLALLVALCGASRSLCAEAAGRLFSAGFYLERVATRAQCDVVRPSLLSTFARAAVLIMRAAGGVAWWAWRATGPGLMSCVTSRTSWLARSPRFISAIVLLLNLPTIEAVCSTCRGAVDGCAGGAACPWLTTVAANAAVVVATATTGAISIAALLPSDLIRAFPRAVLEKIRRLARLPPPGTCFEFDAATTTVANLRAALAQGLIDNSEARIMMAELVDAAPEASMNRLIVACKLLSAELESDSLAPVDDLGGLYVYILKTISLHVLSTRAPIGSSSSTSGRSRASLGAEKWYPSPEVAGIAVPLIIHLLVLFMHACGLAHVHVSSPFFDKVIYETVWTRGYTFVEAFELLVTYLTVLDERPPGITMSNVWENGAQDTLFRRSQDAVARRWGAAVHGTFRPLPLAAREYSAEAQKVGGDAATRDKTWNGASTRSARPCRAFNVGRAHAAADLFPDGTCRYAHICDRFLVDNSKCNSASHSRDHCNSPKQRDGPGTGSGATN